MSEAQVQILNLLKEGKISVEEAERLLKLVADEREQRQGSGEFVEFAKDLPDAVVRNLREAFKTLGDVSRTVGKKGRVVITQGGDKIRRGVDERSFHVKLPTGLEAAEVFVSAKVGSVRIGGAHSDAGLLAVGKKKQVQTGGEKIEINPDDPSKAALFLEAEAGSLSCELHPGVVYDVSVETGAGSVKMDLSELRVRSVNVENSLGTVSIALGSLVADVAVRVTNNAGKVKIRLPEDAGVSASVMSEMGAHNLDEAGLQVDGAKFTTPQFDAASTKFTLDIEQTVGAFKLKRG